MNMLSLEDRKLTRARKLADFSLVEKLFSVKKCERIKGELEDNFPNAYNYK